MLSRTRRPRLEVLRPLAACLPSRLHGELRPILAMSLPLILSQAAQIGIMFIDSVLMGRLGPDALAAGGLAVSSYFFCFVLAFGVIAAAGNLVALAHGRGDRRAVVAATRACLLVSLVMSLAIGTALWHAEPVMRALGQSPDTAARAGAFLRILLWGQPLSMLFLTLRSFASGIGNPGPVPFITLSALLIAPLSGLALSRGIGSWQGMGLDGIALSSVLTYGYMALVFVAVVLKNPVFARYRLFAGFAARDLAAVRPLMRLGVPTSGTMALENCMFTASAYMMGALGPAALAAHQSIFQMVMFSFIVPIGLTQGASMCIGQAAGAGDFSRARRQGQLGQLLAVLWSLLTAGLILLAPQLVLTLFLPADLSGAAAARAIALTLAPMAAAVLICDAWQTVANGILRALKDAHATLVIYALGSCGIGLPLGWFLSRNGLGAPGVWAGMAAGLATVSLLLVRRFGRLSRGLIDGSRAL